MSYELLKREVRETGRDRKRTGERRIVMKNVGPDTGREKNRRESETVIYC